jgi:hypothetical protein
MNLKIKKLAKLRTLYLLIKNLFDRVASLQETDREYAGEDNRVVLELGQEADVYQN